MVIRTVESHKAIPLFLVFDSALGDRGGDRQIPGIAAVSVHPRPRNPCPGGVTWPKEMHPWWTVLDQVPQADAYRGR